MPFGLKSKPIENKHDQESVYLLSVEHKIEFVLRGSQLQTANHTVEFRLFQDVALKIKAFTIYLSLAIVFINAIGLQPISPSSQKHILSYGVQLPRLYG